MITTTLAIDPGPYQSAWAIHDHAGLATGMLDNEQMIGRVPFGADRVVIEMIASYGMAVGFEVFRTCVWIGRFAEAATRDFAEVHLLERMDVKVHLCRSVRATDANIRRALIDRFGGDAAIKRKPTPGPLVGVSKDMWAALAVLVCAEDGVLGMPLSDLTKPKEMK